MVKRAVVVGINDYSVLFPNGKSNLRWCVRDAQAMYHLLVDAFGFDPAQVWLYTDQQANSEQIRQALRYMLVHSEPGDVACFYFSGHGAMVPKGDGTYYEAVVPASGQYISDHDLAVLAAQLEPSVVNFTVILDSCHAGGMHDESEAAVAMRSLRFAAAMIEQILRSMTSRIPFGICLPPGSDALHNNVSNVRDLGNGICSMDEDPDKVFVAQAKSTLIASSKFNEVSQEDPSNPPAIGHGLLTQALLDLVNASNFQVEHRMLLDKLRQGVRDYMNRFYPGQTQTPQLRGQENRMEEFFLEGWRDSR
jgi:hypothetical protein